MSTLVEATDDVNVVAVQWLRDIALGDEGALSSLYPRGIPIGVVTSVGQVDTDIYKHVELQPYVDFSSLEQVIVIVPKGERAR